MVRQPPPARTAARTSSISGATGLAQLLAFLVMPIVSRLYTPTDFGHLAIFTSILSLLLPIVSFRYEAAIPLAADHREAVDVAALSVVLTATTCGTALAVLIIGHLISNYFHDDSVSESYAWMPVAMAVFSLQYIATMWQVRARTFARLAGMRFASIVGTVFCQLVLGYVFGGAISLILASIAGQAMAIAIAVYPYRTRIGRLVEEFGEARIRRAASSFRAFAMFTSPSGIINVRASAAKCGPCSHI